MTSCYGAVKIMMTNVYTTLGLNQDDLALAKPKYKLE